MHDRDSRLSGGKVLMAHPPALTRVEAGQVAMGFVSAKGRLAIAIAIAMSRHAARGEAGYALVAMAALGASAWEHGDHHRFTRRSIAFVGHAACGYQGVGFGKVGDDTAGG